jgi:hypothetical protein
VLFIYNICIFLSYYVPLVQYRFQTIFPDKKKIFEIEIHTPYFLPDSLFIPKSQGILHQNIVETAVRFRVAAQTDNKKSQ